MAKLPTFQSKKISGSGGAVQMNPVQRSMTTAFRKSANVQASDFYQSAGDQAFASAVQGVGQLANKLKVQKQQAELDEIRNIVNLQINAFTNNQQNNPSINSELDAANFFNKNRDNFTKGSSKYVSDILKKELRFKELQTVNNSIIIAQNESKNVVSKNFKSLITQKNELIRKNEITPEDALTPVNKSLQEQVALGLIDQDTAKNISKDALQNFNRISTYGKIQSSESFLELGEVSNIIEEQLRNQDITELQYLDLKKQLDINSKNLSNVNTNKFSETKKILEKEILISNDPDNLNTLVNAYRNLYGDEATEILGKTVEEKANIEFFNKSFLEIPITADEEQYNDNVNFVTNKLINNNPQDKEKIKNLSNYVKSNFKKELKVIINNDLSNKFNESIGGKVSFDTILPYMQYTFGEAGEKAYDKFFKDYSKDNVGNTSQRIDPLLYNEKTFAFNSSFEDRRQLLVAKINKQQELLNIGNVTKQVLDENEINQYKSVIEKLSPNKPEEIQQVVAHLVEYLPSDRILGGIDEIAKSLEGSNSQLTARIIAYANNYNNPNASSILIGAQSNYKQLSETEKKEITTSFKNDSHSIAIPSFTTLRTESMQVAKEIYNYLGGDEQAAKTAMKMVFNEQPISLPSIGHSSISTIPVFYIDKQGQKINIDSDLVENRMNKLLSVYDDSFGDYFFKQKDFNGPLSVVDDFNVLANAVGIPTPPLTNEGFADMKKVNELGINNYPYLDAWRQGSAKKTKAREEIAKRLNYDNVFTQFDPGDNTMNVFAKGSDGSRFLLQEIDINQLIGPEEDSRLFSTLETFFERAMTKTTY